MLKPYYPIYLLLIFLVACAPVAPEAATTNDAAQAADHDNETEHGHEEEHGHDDEDEHGHDEDKDEHGHDDDHADEDHAEKRELGVHEHGAAELLIALANNEIAIELQTPAFNILGFEYAPTSDAELALLADSIATLETGAFLQINADAECILVSADVHADVTDADQTADAQDETTHSDIDATYRLDCAQPENIAELDVSGLFETFPNFEDIDVQWISDTTQSATALTPDNQIVLFK